MSADRAKLIARSQLPVQLAPRPLGQPAAAAAAADSQQQQEQQEGDDVAAAAVRGGDRARDPETYDEGDFYSQLLKQLLEAGGCEGQGEAGRAAEDAPHCGVQCLRICSCLQQPWPPFA
jgi:protein AATF/BFR2